MPTLYTDTNVPTTKKKPVSFHNTHSNSCRR